MFKLKKLFKIRYCPNIPAKKPKKVKKKTLPKLKIKWGFILFQKLRLVCIFFAEIPKIKEDSSPPQVEIPATKPTKKTTPRFE